jgi:phosphoglycerate dehydrogenase-like enzyme
MRNIALALSLLLPALAAAQPKKVVITSPGTYYSPLGEAELAQLRAAAPGVNLVPYDKERLLAEIADADGVIGTITPEMLRAAKRLKWVQVGVAGVERLLTPEFVASPVVLTNCKILQGPEIADHGFALLLALTRELHRIIPRRTAEEWQMRAYSPIELQDKTALIVGMGGIGMQLAIRAHAFGMKVIGIDVRDLHYAPYIQQTAPPDRLEELLPQADAVFIAAPATPQTHRMFTARHFSMMKKTAYFIALSRGTLFDNEALAAAIAARQIAGAGLDVTDPEPLPKGHPLWKHENVIVSPHIAGRSDGEHRRYMELFKENLRRFSRGEALLNVVDKRKGY